MNMKEMDKMSLKELEAIANDSSIPVPDSFGKTLRAEVAALAFLSEEPAVRPRRMLRIAGVAASLALLAGIGLGINSYRQQPKDTFSDPHQAYAMLEASLSYISSKMDQGMDSVTHETGVVLSKTSSIMEKIN